MPFDGLSPIVCGVLGYVSIILYDLNNVTHNNDRMQSLYTVGAGLIGLAFFSTVLPGLSEPNSLPAAVRVIAGILALGFFVLLIYLTFIRPMLEVLSGSIYIKVFTISFHVVSSNGFVVNQ